MSVVTDVLIVADALSDATIAALRDGYDDDGRRVSFGDLNEYRDGGGTALAWGGSKFGGMQVWAGAFNHLRQERLHEWLLTLKWFDRPWVMVLHEFDDEVTGFRLDVESHPYSFDECLE